MAPEAITKAHTANADMRPIVFCSSREPLCRFLLLCSAWHLVHDVTAAEALVDVVVAEAGGDLDAVRALLPHAARQAPEQRRYHLRQGFARRVSSG